MAKLKIEVNKAAFTLAESEDGTIKNFRSNWDWVLNDTDTIESAACRAAKNNGIDVNELVKIKKIELTKNHFNPTFWVTVIMRSYYDCFAEMSFDLVQSVMEDEQMDVYATIFKRVREEKI